MSFEDSNWLTRVTWSRIVAVICEVTIECRNEDSSKRESVKITEVRGSGFCPTREDIQIEHPKLPISDNRIFNIYKINIVTDLAS